MKIRLQQGPNAKEKSNLITKSKNVLPLETATKALLSLSKIIRRSTVVSTKSLSLKERLLSTSSYYLDFDSEDEINNYYYDSDYSTHSKSTTDDDPDSRSQQNLNCPLLLRRKNPYDHYIAQNLEDDSRTKEGSGTTKIGNNSTKNGFTAESAGVKKKAGFYGWRPCSNFRIFLAILAFLVTILYNIHNLGDAIQKVTTRLKTNKSETDESFFNLLPIINLLPHKCNFPKLNPRSPEVMALFKNTINSTRFYNSSFCSQETNSQNVVFTADHQYLKKISELVIHHNRNPDQNYKEPFCCYKALRRIDEAENWMSNKCIKIHLTKNNTKIKIHEEFISLECQMPVFQKNYRDMFAFIPAKPAVESRVNQINSQITSSGHQRDDKINVIIFGMDGVSHLHFKRQMRRSRSYLIKVLKAIPLNGYTKVAENTLPNVIPLLSGMSLEEFKAHCITPQEKELEKEAAQDSGIPFFTPNSQNIHLDNCPFIWKWFSSQGYRTSFAEDQNHIGIFQMYWSQAFREQPTDYYLKTMTRQMEEEFTSPSGQCLGSRKSFKVLLDHMLNVANAFSHKDGLTFQFSWSTRLSHDNMENLHWGDDDLYKTLKTLHDNHHLNNTILVLLSDHGSRLDKIRKLYQGQVEDRMPLAYIVTPPWFSLKYPEATKNLRENSHRLTSAYDLHKTLLDLTHLNNLKDETIKWKDSKLFHRSVGSAGGRHSQSLFERLDDNRSCAEAGVPLHWCLCQDKEPIDSATPIVKEAAQFAVDQINKYVQSKHQKTRSGLANICELLSLSQITEAFKWSNEKIIVKRFGAVNQSHKNISNNYYNHTSYMDLTMDVLILQISFVTVPGEGAFEATVVQMPRSESEQGAELNKWRLTERIARTNLYSDQSFCVEDYDLKEYCFCNNFMEYFL